jgi:hypothetical protein
MTFIDLMLWCPTLDPGTRGSDTSLRPLLASTLVYPVPVVTVLLHNGGVCNGCIPKRIGTYKLHNETNIILTMTKNIRFFVTFIFYHREVGKQDQYI